MAKDKNSFLLYKDMQHTINKLSDEQAGVLFKLIFSYVNDEEPQPPDFLMEVVFEPIKQQLKRDLKRYAKTIEGRRKAGLASADKRKQNQQ